MPKYDLSKRIVNGELSRRQMLKGLGAAGVLSTTVPLLPKTAFAKQQVQLFTWGGYDDEGLYAGYIDKHGGDPEYSIFGDAEEYEYHKPSYPVVVVYISIIALATLLL